MSKPELLLVGALSPEVEAAMEHDYVVHRLWQSCSRRPYHEIA